jgi:hypothetical protein
MRFSWLPFLFGTFSWSVFAVQNDYSSIPVSSLPSQQASILIQYDPNFNDKISEANPQTTDLIHRPLRRRDHKLLARVRAYQANGQTQKAFMQLTKLAYKKSATAQAELSALYAQAYPNAIYLSDIWHHHALAKNGADLIALAKQGMSLMPLAKNDLKEKRISSLVFKSYRRAIFFALKQADQLAMSEAQPLMQNFKALTKKLPRVTLPLTPAELEQVSGSKAVIETLVRALINKDLSAQKQMGHALLESVAHGLGLSWLWNPALQNLPTFSLQDGLISAVEQEHTSAQPEPTDVCPQKPMPLVKDKLLFTEIGMDKSGYLEEDANINLGWVEIYNAYDKAVDLSNFRLFIRRSFGPRKPNGADEVLDLPKVMLAPGQHYVLEFHSKRSGNYAESHRFSSSKYVYKISHFSFEQGNITLRNKKLFKIEDAVLWHLDDETKFMDPTRWQGPYLKPLPKSKFIASWMRTYPYQDTDTAADWEASVFVTKGGTNDIPGMKTAQKEGIAVEDLDKDGIPDLAEASACATFNGLPYHQWGARPDQRDMFVQIDRMDHEGDAFDIKRATIEMLIDAYQQEPGYEIALHVDAGMTLSSEQAIDLANHNLYTADRPADQQGGRTVPYAKYIAAFKPNESQDKVIVDQSEAGEVLETIPLKPEEIAYHANYPARYMDIRREGTFYYVLLADSVVMRHVNDGKVDQKSVVLDNKAAGEAFHNFSMLITMFGYENEQFEGAETQLARIIFHELGHLFGLHHGGLDAINFKPNHISSMNYIYMQALLDRPPYQAKYRPSFELLGGMLMNYSLGECAPLDESNLQGETIDLPVYGKVPMSELMAEDDTVDLNADGKQSVLKDYNEWAHIIKQLDKRRKKHMGKRKKEMDDKHKQEMDDKRKQLMDDKRKE